MICLTILLVTGCFNCFHSVAQGEYSNNFMIMSLLDVEDYDVVHARLILTFEKIFQLPIHHRESMSELLKHVMIIGDKFYNCKYDQENEVSASEIQKLFVDHMLHYSSEIKKVFSVQSKDNNTEGLKPLQEFFENHFTNVLVYNLKQVIIKSEGSSAMERVVYPEEAIEKAVDEFIGVDQINQTVINKEAFLAYIQSIKTESFDSKKVYFQQYIEFRDNGIEMLLDLLRYVLESYSTGKVVFDFYTHRKFTDILKTTILMNNMAGQMNTHAHIEQFFMETLMTYKESMDSQVFDDLVAVVFKLFTKDITTYTFESGRKMMLYYLMGDFGLSASDVNRTTLQVKKFSKEGISFTVGLSDYKYINEVNQLYIIDLLYTAPVSELRLSDEAFKNIMNKPGYFKGFVANKLFILNYFDKFFSKDESKTNNYFEYYNALYNSLMVMLVESSDLDKETPDQMTKMFEDFLQFAKATNLEVDKFPFRIKTFYPYFKLEHVMSNIIYFKANDNLFLRFNKPKLAKMEEYLSQREDIITFIKAWKDHVNGIKNKLVKLDMLSDNVVTAVFVNNFYTETVEKMQKLFV